MINRFPMNLGAIQMNKESPIIDGKIAVILLGTEGLPVLERLYTSLEDVTLFVHESVTTVLPVKTFSKVAILSCDIFKYYRGIIYIMPIGVVVRSVSPLIEHKLTDPAIVVVDVFARWSISFLSGHERGANRLAEQVGWITGAEPIVTTTTDARKDLIVGVGFRRGTSMEIIINAVKSVFAEKALDPARIRVLSSIDLKKDEAGIHGAAKHFNCGLRFLRSEELSKCANDFEKSDFVMETVGVPAVCGPAAMLGGSKTCLIVNKQIVRSVTVAVAQENCMP